MHGRMSVCAFCQWDCVSSLRSALRKPAPLLSALPLILVQVHVVCLLGVARGSRLHYEVDTLRTLAALQIVTRASSCSLDEIAGALLARGGTMTSINRTRYAQSADSLVRQVRGIVGSPHSCACALAIVCHPSHNCSERHAAASTTGPARWNLTTFHMTGVHLKTSFGKRLVGGCNSSPQVLRQLSKPG